MRDRQEAYYAALAASDRASSATPFVEFMLSAFASALREALAADSAATDQVADQVTDQVLDPVARLLSVLASGEALKASELMKRLGLRHRPTFRERYLLPALAAGAVEMCQPDSPRSPTQRYRRV